MKAQPNGRRDRVEQGNAPVDDGAKEAGVGRPSSANPRLHSPVYLSHARAIKQKTLKPRDIFTRIPANEPAYGAPL